jgi:hypothetical protein
LTEDSRQAALSLLPLNTLTDWAAPNQVAVGKYVDLKRVSASPLPASAALNSA